MIKHINKKIGIKKLSFLLIFLTFFIKNWSEQPIFFKIQHTKMNTFINKVRYLQDVDSVKTQIIQNQSKQLQQYRQLVKSLQNKSKIDSLIIFNNNKRIQQLQKPQPFFVKKQAFYIYGLITAIILYGVIR